MSLFNAYIYFEDFKCFQESSYQPLWISRHGVGDIASIDTPFLFGDATPSTDWRVDVRVRLEWCIGTACFAFLLGIVTWMSVIGMVKWRFRHQWCTAFVDLALSYGRRQRQIVISVGCVWRVVMELRVHISSIMLFLGK